jgi:hypothetical protein
MTVYERIDAALQELFEHVDAGRLTILREDYAPRPEAEQVRAIESAHGPLPPGLAAIYASVGSIDIEWEAPLAEPDGDHTKVRGAIRVPTLERMFGDWKDSLWFDSSPPDAVGRSLRPLDRFTPEWWAVLRPGDPQVFLHEAGIESELHATGLDVARWLDLSIEARFYDGWLFACVDRPGRPASAALADMARDTRTLFPGIDLSAFTPPSARRER